MWLCLTAISVTDVHVIHVMAQVAFLQQLASPVMEHWGTRTRHPSTFICLIFQITSEPMGKGSVTSSEFLQRDAL